MSYSRLTTIVIFLCSLLGLAATSYAASQVPNLKAYYSAKTKLEYTKTVNDAPPATDITVVNQSRTVFNASVPNTPVFDTLYPSPPYNVDHIYNQRWSGDTLLVLSGTNGNVFFSRPVWNHAVVTVTMYQGRLVATEIGS